MKFFRIRDFRLMILVPSMGLTLLFLIVAVSRSQYFMNDQTDILIGKISEKRGEEISSFIKRYFKNIQLTNYYLSKVPFVTENFKHFKRYGNSKEAGDRLMDAIKEFRKKAPHEFNYDFQFTLPGGITLLRTKDNSIGHLRLDYELAAIEGLKRKEERVGFELLDDGLYLKSVVPLMDREEFWGVAEVQLPIDEMLVAFEQETGLKAAFFVEIDNLPSGLINQLTFLRRWVNEKETLFKVGDSEIDVDEHWLYKTASHQASKKYWVTVQDDSVLELFELRDVMGTRLGYWVVQHDLYEIIQMKKEIEKMQMLLLLVVFVVLTAVLYGLLSQLATKPLRALNKRIESFVLGDYSKAVNVGQSKELRELDGWMSKLAGRSKEVTRFAKEIGEGNLNAKYELSGEGDQLGGALVEMRDRLVSAEDKANERSEVERKEKWAAEGVAQMGDILRQHSNNIEELNGAVITFLVNYVGIVQGAVYVLEKDENTDDDFLRLSAAYAYEQKKYIDLKILIGEGLVGTCAAEKEKIYLENIPADHVQITSGLGGGSPCFLFLFPLIMNEQLYGVVELSNFEEVENFRLDFAENIASSYAATLANVKINARTKYLLEQYQEQGEALENQEETMKENLEEMLTAQEEALLRERVVSSLIESIDMSIIRLELSIEGMVVNTNDYFLSLTEQMEEGVVGKHFESFVDVESRVDVKKAWESMQRLRPYNCQINLMDKFSHKIALVAVFSPIIDSAGELTKTHFLAQKLHGTTIHL